MIPWLERFQPFPPLACALAEPNGLLAAGGELERGLGELRTGTELAPQRGDGWRKRAVVEDALLLCADASASWERAVGLGEDRPPSGGARCTQSG